MVFFISWSSPPFTTEEEEQKRLVRRQEAMALVNQQLEAVASVGFMDSTDLLSLKLRHQPTLPEDFLN